MSNIEVNHGAKKQMQLSIKVPNHHLLESQQFTAWARNRWEPIRRQAVFIITLLILLREMSGPDDSWCKLVVLISEPGCLGGLRGQSLVLWAANFGVRSRCQIVDRGQAKLGQGNHGVNRVASASTRPRQHSVV